MISEKEELNYLKKDGFKYLARDKDFTINAYKNKPCKGGDMWISKEIEQYAGRNLARFKTVTWENEEPTLINELLEVITEKKWFCKKCGGNDFLFEATRTGAVHFDEKGEMEALSEHDEFDYTISCKSCGKKTCGYDSEEMEEIADLKEVQNV